MASSRDHAIGALAAVTTAHAFLEARDHGQLTAAPLLSGLVAAGLGSLPDALEPATNPHHRKFFHSAAFGTAVAIGLGRAYAWQPPDPTSRIVRALGLIAGSAYLVHLAMDAVTPRSIPLL